jgi:hypothetical protein
MSVQERLKIFIESQGLNVKQFEQKSGLSNGFVKSISRSIGGKALPKIKKAFPDLNELWLLHGNGNMLKSTHNFPNLNEHKSTSDSVDYKPISDSSYMQAILDLTNSSKLQAEAYKIQAEAQRTSAENDKELINLLKANYNTGNQDNQLFQLRLSALQEFVTQYVAEQRGVDPQTVSDKIDTIENEIVKDAERAGIQVL